MLSRRNMVLGLTAAGVIPSTSLTAATSKPKALPPPGTCDCHVHVLDPDRFPFSPKRKYTPGPATAAQLLNMHETLGVQRVVLVQNSVYAANHDCLLDGLKQLGTQRARGIMTVGPSTSDSEIEMLDRAGVRGARLNLEVGKDRDASGAIAAVNSLATRIPQTWNIDINAALSVITAMHDALAKSPRPVVLDHFSHVEADRGVNQPGFSELISLLKTNRVYVKLSGPYQISKLTDYRDVGIIAKALVAAAPSQLVWGSDWPHTGGANRPADQKFDVVEPYRPEDDGKNFNLITQWVSDSSALRQILVNTPARVYGFASVG